MENDKDLERIRIERMKKLLKESNNPVHNKPVDVTNETFQDFIQSNPLVVVDCWAAWCTPCHMVAPVIEELAKDHAGTILFGKLNVDENRKIAMQYRIMSIPTLLVFKNGDLIDQIVGAMPRRILEPKITKHLNYTR